jgi:hypothetical protein
MVFITIFLVYKTIDEIARDIVDSDDMPQLPPIGALSIEDNRTANEKAEDDDINPDEIPDIDDIPDMEDDLLEEEDPAALATTKVASQTGTTSNESERYSPLLVCLKIESG